MSTEEISSIKELLDDDESLQRFFDEAFEQLDANSNG